ncbi:ABC transporter ATP-binding protein/permease [Clostridium tagluense]|uniref:ABC transporter ATP-binding protein n=1 Tax=Clostridium tagluense TaxID=360422 RepID=UPI001C0E30DE|nr:ABC transporter ATP-binding protein [Clostridium tagluense]MBU3127842.1 ABC transporter ATP-binding protein/permease [Clostridium tagluense]MCB2310131.1 ABC transporter ATP-binding protein/permease [Clostridium tagluense]MCB2315227.1 ABC transporter ATP-binding protein/permease [Clostridium tagluense]MCB2319831.1 ABC transporter ATP-binding protein/permease [Clostridium tagluense]MCB2324970.1 ABC transporter ATP-binding protein/permease [Clostridium tagluense]
MKHYLEILKKKKLLVVIYILLGIVVAFLNAFSASYFQKVLDDCGDKSLSITTVCIYGFVLVLICCLNYFHEYPSCELSQSIYLNFKLKALRKMSTIDYRYYQLLGTGNLIQKIENGANAGKSILFDFYFRLFSELVSSIVFSLIFIANIDKNIMIYIAFGYVLVFVVTNILLKYLYEIKAHILNNEEIFNKYVVRGFMELIVFRTNKKFKHEIGKTTIASEEIVKSKTKMRMIHEAFFAIFALFITLIKVIIIYISWKNNELSVGDLVALLILIDKAYSPIAIFNVLFVQYKLDMSAFRRYTDLLDMPDDVRLNSGRIVNSIEGNIYFKNVCFSYGEKNIFKNLSFDIPAGSSVAFVGESGSGKSTIVKQIMGLIKPDAGSIYVDRNDLSELNLNKFYNYISYTSQESPVFDGTLRENIVFDKDISDEAIIEVLERVGLTPFYSALPKGLHTEVGESGVMLSGGERQRLALARVFFGDAKIVILDEATSAMDNITEELVMENVMQFLKNKTVITIAHRLSTIKNVDKIYAFKDGKIVGAGGFKELLDSNQYFGNLWNATMEI